MIRKLSVLIFIAISISLITFFILSQDIYSSANRRTGQKYDDKLVIAHTELFGKLERPQVFFDHGLHDRKFKKEGCKTCHPPTEEDNLIFERPFKLTKKDRESAMNAYHEKCIGCHTKMTNEGKKAGPVTCGDCHVKEFESVRIKTPVFEFDFSVHAKHVKNLHDKCGLCHHTYYKEYQELVYEQGTEQSCCYCHDTTKKRGPVLAVETAIIQKKSLTIRKVSHSLCLNCHVYLKEKGYEAGPVECSKCHTGKYKTLAELANVPRPDRDQPKKPFIRIEDAKMKGILFDHRYHEKNAKTCRECHHETLNACKECHNLTGSPEGNWINIAGAYHDGFSSVSCAGCHRNRESGKNCSGCHHHLLDMDLQAKGPKKAVCSVCHGGKKGSPGAAKSILASILSSEKVPEKVTIKILEREYEPSEFPHRKVIRKLVEISNSNKMATYFHRNMQTICDGCHHQSRSDAEAQKGKPPFCRNCHSLAFDYRNLNRPRLLATYHRQCLGCHEKMDIKQKGCADCHKEKAVRPNPLNPLNIRGAGKIPP